MNTAKVFKSGNSNAIRIPKEIHLKDEYVVREVGEGILLVPTDDPWLPLRMSMGRLPEDFLNDREQPDWEESKDREEI